MKLLIEIIWDWVVDNEELCSYCDWNNDGNVNTNQFNMCEGGNCEHAFECYLEEREV